MAWKNRYFHMGLTVFCTVGAILLFYDTLFGSKALQTFFHQFMGAVRPAVYGALMAYLLAPMVNFFERRPHPVEGKPTGKGRSFAAVRGASILLTWMVICVLLYLLASVLVPELYRSVMQLISNVETYYNTISGWVQHMLESNPDLESWVAAQMDEVYKQATGWLNNELLPQARQLMMAVSGGLLTVVGFLGDLLVGIIVSVYFLATKERCAAYARKVACGLLPREKVYWLVRGTRKVDSIFSGFVRGKLLDSLIIGILCFIGCSVLKLPYTPLVSVFVGVTNVIPFFGPFLGAIPSTFLILLVSPVKALYFVIFVFALQQLDGNVIGPKILGNKTGLSSLWVIVAILVGGSFFGVAGMFFGVPVCACLYNAVNFYVDMRLRRQGLPVETAYYGQDILKDRGEMGENTPENGK